MPVVITRSADRVELTTHLTYNKVGRIKSTEDENGQVTSLEYDTRGRPTKTTLPSGLAVEKIYRDFRPSPSTGHGQHVSIVARHKDTEGNVVSEEAIHVDGLGREIQSSVSGAHGYISTSTVYNAKGQPVTIIGPYATNTMDFVDAPQGPMQTFVYDDKGRIARITDDDASTTCSYIGLL